MKVVYLWIRWSSFIIVNSIYTWILFFCRTFYRWIVFLSFTLQKKSNILCYFTRWYYICFRSLTLWESLRWHRFCCWLVWNLIFVFFHQNAMACHEFSRANTKLLSMKLWMWCDVCWWFIICRPIFSNYCSTDLMCIYQAKKGPETISISVFCMPFIVKRYVNKSTCGFCYLLINMDALWFARFSTLKHIRID